MNVFMMVSNSTADNVGFVVACGGDYKAAVDAASSTLKGWAVPHNMPAKQRKALRSLALAFTARVLSGDANAAAWLQAQLLRMNRRMGVKFYGGAA